MVKPNPISPQHLKIAELAGWEESRYDNLWNNLGLDISTKLFCNHDMFFDTWRQSRFDCHTRERYTFFRIPLF